MSKLNLFFLGCSLYENDSNNYNKLLSGLSHNKSYGLALQSICHKFDQIEDIVCEIPTKNFVINIPLQYDTRTSLFDVSFQASLIRVAQICNKYENVFIATGNLWDDAYGTVEGRDIVQHIMYLLKVHNVPINRLIYYYNNTEIYKSWIQHLEKFNNHLKPLLIYNPIYLNRFSQIKSEYKVEIGNGNKKKHFLMLNRRHTSIRFLIATYLQKEYSSKCYISYNCTNPIPTIREHFAITELDLENILKDLKIDFLNSKDLYNFKTKLPLKLDNQTDGGLPVEMQDILPTYYIHDSACFINSETHYDKIVYQEQPDNINFNFNLTGGFHTEKSLKSFLWGLPTIWLANPQTLETMKTLGFKTYDGLIDESYDTIEDRHDRTYFIKKEIDKIAKITDLNGWYRQGISTYEYNYNLLQSYIQRDTVKIIADFCNEQVRL